MRVIRDPISLQRLALRWKGESRRVGFVPTMGALHAGHLKLIETACRSCDPVVVSIYVNPTQFGSAHDLDSYPRPFSRDARLCRAAGVDVLFAPQNLFTPDHSSWVIEESASLGRCGPSRPGHFRGVATVVVKLLNLILPERVFLGEKDAQQVEVIQRVVRDLNIPTRVVPVPTVRDQDGLALSSRNQHLSVQEREQALALPLLLMAAVHQKKPVLWLKAALSRCPGIRLDYIEKSNGRLCAAVWVGKTRLIDNVPCF